MFLNNCFKINNKQVIWEMVEGEVIIINLEKGHYYSLNETAGDVWMGVTSGLSAENIIATMQTGYNADEILVKASVEKFLVELIREEILIDSGGSDTNASVRSEFGVNKPENGFTAPALEKYTDMEDLLLLDPIHDVDEQGWPNVP